MNLELRFALYTGLMITSSLLFSLTTKAQMPMHFTPPTPRPAFYPNYWRGGNNETVNLKYDYHIVFTNGKDTTVYTKIYADSPAQYIMMENKSVRKKDSGRYIKIYPSQTRSISHTDVNTEKDHIGQPNDSCWLFKVIEGNINAYTAMSEPSVDDEFILYLQKGDGPIIPISDPRAVELFRPDDKAVDLFSRKKYNRAIKRYNSDKN